jgi:hypothetical protein
VEGCLDINASNFDLNADRACPDCCTYPSVFLTLSQKWVDRNFALTDTLRDIHDRPYRINDLKYYLSSWTWYGTDHQWHTVDSAQITCNGNIIHYTPDILLIDAKQFNYTLGTYHQSPDIDSIRFLFGLSESFGCLNDSAAPVILSDKSPLWDSPVQSLATVRLVLQPDISSTDLDTIFIHYQQVFGMNYDLILQPGFSTTFKLTVDYFKWFGNADIQDLNSFAVSIQSGVNGSFTRTP